MLSGVFSECCARPPFPAFKSTCVAHDVMQVGGVSNAMPFKCVHRSGRAFDMDVLGNLHGGVCCVPT
jgi:hypothetical protein